MKSLKKDQPTYPHESVYRKLCHEIIFDLLIRSYTIMVEKREKLIMDIANRLHMNDSKHIPKYKILKYAWHMLADYVQDNYLLFLPENENDYCNEFCDSDELLPMISEHVYEDIILKEHSYEFLSQLCLSVSVYVCV